MGPRLHVPEWGNSDGPPILVIHGWSQNHLCWVKQTGPRVDRAGDDFAACRGWAHPVHARSDRSTASFRVGGRLSLDGQGEGDRSEQLDKLTGRAKRLPVGH